MSHANQTHPAPDQLRAFALGQLSAGGLADIEAHLADCAECTARLADVPDDTFLGRLRGRPASDTIPPDQGGALSQLDLPQGLVDHPRYRIQRVLGAGGMGVVYLAFHRLLERPVAIKVINAGLVSNQLALERFRQEFKAAGQLSHPNIIAAHDAEQVGGVHFLVMEYVDGISLDRLVAKQGPLGVEQACHFLKQASAGLQHAHEKGMVHRDIKPHNLMVTRKGQVKVLDFGLARLQEGTGDRPLTTIGVVLGTPDYIAPEQVTDSRRVDIRADIYSLGCTLYFLLGGQPPFPEGSAIEKALSHVDGMPQPLRTLRPEVPPELAVVIERMMAKSPDVRYQTPDEVARALAPFARPGGTSASRPAAPPPVPVLSEPEPAAERPAPPRPRRRRKPPALPLGQLLLLGGLGLGVLVFGVALAIIVPRLVNHSGTLPTKQPLVAAAGALRVLLVVPYRKFWWPDYEGVERVLRDGRAEVVVSSSQPGHAWGDGPGARSLKVDVPLSEVSGDNFDAVVFCGGRQMEEYINHTPAARHAQRVIAELLAKNKRVTAVCAGTIVLADAGVLEGKKAIGFKEVRARLEEKGATLVDEPVVEDGLVITGRDPEAAGPLAERLLLRLMQKRR